MKTSQELIKDYGISLATEYKPGVGFVPTGKLMVRRADLAKKDGYFNAIVAAKSEIIALLTAEEKARKEAAELRQAKIDSIPGLKEIRAAMDDLKAWQKEFNDSFRDCGGLGVRSKPVYDYDNLCATYPRAAAYLKAEEYADSSNYVKSAAGKKALEAIINGADPAETTAAMEAEWNGYCDEHIWD